MLVPRYAYRYTKETIESSKFASLPVLSYFVIFCSYLVEFLISILKAKKFFVVFCSINLMIRSDLLITVILYYESAFVVIFTL